MDSLKSSQLRRRNLTPSLVSQKLWSGEKSTRDLLSFDDKGVNVQVIVRCRPLSRHEEKTKTPLVISCDAVKQEVTATLNTANKQLNKSYIFDKVFGPASQQKDLYDHVVAPIVNDALDGYNCTIFAYGQTGTGKTYTMEGEGRREKNGEFHKDAGVIPRAVQQIFDILQAQNAKYNMKVTFLELYNEEITDLLASDEGSKNPDEKSKKPITLVEDGKGTVFVRGLEEEMVQTADEIYKILEKGSAKRHNAETFLNKQSNRSHSIFSITMHIKECTSKGLELVKCGKLTLVDLAGSENILRSGVRGDRAREAGEINKSLLALGRVINALVENSEHVPYRDSKLTRLLRDSLGGKTQTCIIAALSPSIHCLEETLNTLEYAFRAKTIKNWPEVNQKVIKEELINDLCKEIHRLKQELHATRNKNGIHVSKEQHLTEEAKKKAMAEKLRLLEHDPELNCKQMMEAQKLYNYQQQLAAGLSEKLEMTQRESKKTECTLPKLEGQLRHAQEIIEQKEYLITSLLGSEKTSTEIALELRGQIESADLEFSRLLAIYEHKNHVEDKKKILIQNFHIQLAEQLKVLDRTVSAAVAKEEEQLKGVQENMQSFLSSKTKASYELQIQLKKIKQIHDSGVQHLDDSAEELYGNFQLAFGNLSSEILAHSSSVVYLVREIFSDAEAMLNDLQDNLIHLKSVMAAFSQLEQQNQDRTFGKTECTSEVLLNLTKTISAYIYQMTTMEEELQKFNDSQLSALTKKFEELSACEERELLHKVAEVLASSHAQKKRLIQTTLAVCREHANNRASQLNKEMTGMLTVAYSTKEKWTNFIEEAEKSYIQSNIATDIWRSSFAKSCEWCMENSRVLTEHWRKAPNSFPSLQRSMESIRSILKRGIEANDEIHAQFSSVASTKLEETDISGNQLLTSIEYLMQLDHDACQKASSMIGLCSENMKEMKSIHGLKISEIQETAGKFLIDDLTVYDNLLSAEEKQNSLCQQRNQLKVS